jgi:hypothetical protein
VRPPPTPPPPPPTTHHPTHHLHLHHPPAPTPSECAHTAPNVCARRPAQQAPSHTHLFSTRPTHNISVCSRRHNHRSPPVTAHTAARPRASESATSTTPSTPQTWRNDVHHSLGGSFRSCPGESRTDNTHDTHRKLPLSHTISIHHPTHARTRPTPMTIQCNISLQCVGAACGKLQTQQHPPPCFVGALQTDT